MCYLIYGPGLQDGCSFGARLMGGKRNYCLPHRAFQSVALWREYFYLHRQSCFLGWFQYWTLFLNLQPSEITVFYHLQFCQCLLEADAEWWKVVEHLIMCLIITCLMFSSQTCQCLIKCWVYSAFVYPINSNKHPIMCRGQQFLAAIWFLQ